MFQRNETRWRKVGAAVMLIRSRQRGETVPYEDIERAIGEKRMESAEFWHVMNSVRKVLLKEDGLALLTIRNEGFRLPMYNQQVTECGSNRIRRSRSQAQRGIREVAAVMPGSLEPREQMTRAFFLQQMEVQRAVAVSEPLTDTPNRYVSPLLAK